VLEPLDPEHLLCANFAWKGFEEVAFILIAVPVERGLQSGMRWDPRKHTLTHSHEQNLRWSEYVKDAAIRYCLEGVQIVMIWTNHSDVSLRGLDHFIIRKPCQSKM